MKNLLPTSRRMTRSARIAALGGLTLVLASCADTPLSTMDPQSPIAGTLDTFLVWLLVAAGVVFVIIQGAVIYMAKRFGVPAPDDPSMVYPDEEFPEQNHGNDRLEIAWTIAPAIIMAVIGVFTVWVMLFINDVDADPNAQIASVTVVGQQWWWEFQYDLDGDGEPEIVTANELVLPVDEEIRLHVTSRDVIHSFWVPALNGKRDAVPGLYSTWTIEAGTEGRFPGECTEFCGLSHAYMEKFAVGIPADEWAVWAEQQQRSAIAPEEGTAAAAGWEVFENQCASCHIINGLTSHNEGEGPDTFALYSTVHEDDGDVEDRFDRPPVQYIDNQTQIAGAAPNLTHFQSRSSFAGAIFELYKNPDQMDYMSLADDGILNRGALEAWIINAPEEKANAWDSPMGQRGMTPFLALSAEDVDNLVEFLTNLEYEGSE